jgi:flagellar hook-associated protein 2
MGTINLLSGGLDVQNIVEQLIYVERAPARRLETQSTTIQSKLTAFQSFNTKLSSLLDKANAILFGEDTPPIAMVYPFEDRFETSVFAGLTASSSDEVVLSATASTGTAAGAYTINITDLARARSVAADNFADTDTTATGTGTLVFTVGTEDPVTVTIDEDNNTLEGVRKAINAANAGVSATIINDGTAGSPYKLVISADESGTANSFTFTDNLSGGKALNLVEKQEATDAEFSVNGIDITKSSNTVSDVIEGVTFSLKNTGVVTLTVDQDFDSMVTAVKDLATAYNDTNSFANSQFRYDPKTKTGGVLTGDSTLRFAQSKLRSILSQSVDNDFTSYAVLAQVGIKFGNDGSITVDETKLRDALANDVTAVAALFLGNGTPGTDDIANLTDGRVTYAGKTDATQAGTYAVTVTALAERAQAVGAEGITTLSQDETLTVTYGGTEVLVNLTAGDTLENILTKLTDEFATAGIAATATDDGGGRILIETTGYGSAESITVVSDVAAAPGSTGFGTSPISDSGTDIEGTINGHAATGNGLELKGADGQPEEGLSLTIAQTVVGAYGSIDFTPGTPGDPGSSILVNLQTALKTITDPLSGPIHHATDALNQTIRSLKDQIESWDDRLEIRKELLTKEFSRADQALRLLSVTQTSLNNQISSLSSF